MAPAAGKTTLAEYGRSWLAGRSDLRPVTRAKYEHMLERHVLPAFGGYELAALTASAVRNWYMGMRRRYANGTAADDCYRMLRTIVLTAVSDGLIVKSPCQVKGAGNARSAERPVASVAEVTAAVEATEERYRLAILLAAWCQLRRDDGNGLLCHAARHRGGFCRSSALSSVWFRGVRVTFLSSENPSGLDPAGVALVTAGLVALVLPLVQGRALGGRRGRRWSAQQLTVRLSSCPG